MISSSLVIFHFSRDLMIKRIYFKMLKKLKIWQVPRYNDLNNEHI